MDASSTKVNLENLKNKKQSGRTIVVLPVLILFLATTMLAMSIDVHLTASITLAIDGGGSSAGRSGCSLSI